MKIREQAMVKQGRQERVAYVELELDIEALGQMAMDKVSKKFEALDGAIKCCVKLPKPLIVATRGFRECPWNAPSSV